MTCENANATIDFIDLNFEIRPLTMDFRRDEAKLDSLRAKFTSEVAQEFQEYTQEGGHLSREQPVEVKFDGDAVFRMLYVPDGVRFGRNNLHIEFFDLQRSLTIGTVDFQRDSVKLRDAYQKIFDSSPEAKKNYNGIKFSVPDESFEELLARRGDKVLIGRKTNPRVEDLVSAEWSEQHPERTSDYKVPPAMMGPYIRAIESRRTINIIDGHNAVDFDMVSPYEAMVELNEKFKVRTWTGADGYLWVGKPEATGYTHVATSEDDDRVWKISDHDIRPPSEPINQVIVRGKWMDDPSEGVGERIGEGFPLIGSGTDKDLRAEAIAHKPDVKYGQEVSPVERDVAKNMLRGLAENLLIQKTKEAWSGEIEILPSASGTSVSDPRFVRVGDPIILIPATTHDDRNYDSVLSCDEWPITQGVYLITGFRHKIADGGNYIIKLSVVPYPEVDLPDRGSIKNDIGLEFQNTKSYLRFWDSQKEEYMTDEAFDAEESAGKSKWLEG